MAVKLDSDSGSEQALAYCKHFLQLLRLIRNGPTPGGFRTTP